MEPVVEAEILVLSVSIDVPETPMSPLVEIKLIVPEVKVAAPVRVIEPPALAVTLMMPDAPVETLALIDTLLLPVSVASVIVPAPDMESALEIVSPLPDVMEMSPEVSTIGPSVTVPLALMVRSRVPNVIVCPLELKVPPFANCKL